VPAPTLSNVEAGTLLTSETTLPLGPEATLASLPLPASLTPTMIATITMTRPMMLRLPTTRARRRFSAARSSASLA
jgi:hypothetical protein